MTQWLVDLEFLGALLGMNSRGLLTLRVPVPSNPAKRQPFFVDRAIRQHRASGKERYFLRNSDAIRAAVIARVGNAVGPAARADLWALLLSVGPNVTDDFAQHLHERNRWLNVDLVTGAGKLECEARWNALAIDLRDTANGFERAFAATRRERRSWSERHALPFDNGLLGD